MHDFIEHNSIDPLVIVQKYNTYHQFLLKLKEVDSLWGEYEEQVMTMLSLEILNGKRVHEIVLAEMLLQNGRVSIEEYQQKLNAEGISWNDHTFRSVMRVFTLEFFNQSGKTKYGKQSLIEQKENLLVWNEQIQNSLRENVSFRNAVGDLLATARRHSTRYDHHQALTLHKKYTRKDVCRLLNWDNDESSTIYGYKTKHGTCPIFVTYHKSDKVESSVAYGDELINQETMHWFTRSNRSLASEEVKKILGASENGTDIHIFVKKDDDEGGDFYYLGQALPEPESVQESLMKDKNHRDIPVVQMDMKLEKSVEQKLYRYLVESI